MRQIVVFWFKVVKLLC